MVLYSILRQSESLAEVVEESRIESPQEAQKKAQEIARIYPKERVYVTWFRAECAQRGYLNPNGNVAFVGEKY